MSFLNNSYSESMKQERALIFELLPVIEHMDIFIRLDIGIENSLEIEKGRLAEVYERVQSALMFFCQVKTESESDLWRNAAHLRAGLNEFYSIEDAARRDFKLACLGKGSAKICDSKNPLLHLMYLLRNVNVHAELSNTDIHHSSVVSNVGGDNHEIKLKALVLRRRTIDQLLRSEKAKKCYNHAELERAAEWLDRVQHIFGIGEVFRKGLSLYCGEILDSLHRVEARLVISLDGYGKRPNCLASSLETTDKGLSKT